MEWKECFNVLGLYAMIAILIPNIIYAIKFKDVKNKCTNKFMNVLEMLARLDCMVLMLFCIRRGGFGFHSVEEAIIYVLGNIILILAYWVIWISYFRNQNTWKSISLAVLPTAVFLLSGITQQYVALTVSAVIFGIAHIYVTYKNVKE